MRILIDECVDPRAKQLFTAHEVVTVHDKGWDALEDGRLLDMARREFDVFVPIDGGLEHQQNLAKFEIAVIVVHVAKNQFQHYRALHKELLVAVENARAGTDLHVRPQPTYRWSFTRRLTLQLMCLQKLRIRLAGDKIRFVHDPLVERDGRVDPLHHAHL